MFLFIRIYFVVAVVVLSGASMVNAASVPYTFEDDFGGILSGIIGLGGAETQERNTCDPEFWDVLKDRAWQEAQREITQNNNIIARPDSVLSMTCFESFNDHLATYADDFFPGDPQESVGLVTRGVMGKILKRLSGVITDIAVIKLDRLYYAEGVGMNELPRGWGGELSISVSGTDGFLMYALLEMLVLDQLVDGVSGNREEMGVTADEVMRVFDIVENPIMAACAVAYKEDYKRFYIDDNFPATHLGGRGSVDVGMDNRVDDGRWYSCSRMAAIWKEAYCYNMLTESGMFGSTPDHDGFYPLSRYREEAASGRDFRTRETMCDPPTDNFDLTDYLPDLTPIDTDEAKEYLCQLASHGMPAFDRCVSSSGGAREIDDIILDCLPAIETALTGIFGDGDRPNWETASTGAAPDAGDPGGVDQYIHFLGLRDSTDCSSIVPIKTGYIVKRTDGTQYIDAVCPAPGCYFNPPSDIAGTGSCN